MDDGLGTPFPDSERPASSFLNSPGLTVSMVRSPMRPNHPSAYSLLLVLARPVNPETRSSTISPDLAVFSCHVPHPYFCAHVLGGFAPSRPNAFSVSPCRFWVSGQASSREYPSSTFRVKYVRIVVGSFISDDGTVWTLFRHGSEQKRCPLRFSMKNPPQEGESQKEKEPNKVSTAFYLVRPIWFLCERIPKPFLLLVEQEQQSRNGWKHPIDDLACPLSEHFFLFQPVEKGDTILRKGFLGGCSEGEEKKIFAGFQGLPEGGT